MNTVICTFQVVERQLAPNTTSYVFLMEFIAVAQACTCVYENGEHIRLCFIIYVCKGIMIMTYGLVGGFLTVASLLFFLGAYTRGASINPLGPMEAAWNGVIT